MIKFILKSIFWMSIGYLFYGKWGFNGVVGIIAFIAFMNLMVLGKNEKK